MDGSHLRFIEQLQHPGLTDILSHDSPYVHTNFQGKLLHVTVGPDEKGTSVPHTRMTTGIPSHPRFPEPNRGM